MSAQLAGLFIHPVKSAAGIACHSARLGPHGLEHDREWLIVDPQGRFVTQRDEARLALLATSIADGQLHLANPQGAGPSLSLDHEGESCQVQVWGAHCDGFDAGAASAAFLSDWLERPLRLVRFDRRRARLSNPDWTGGREVPTLFPDGYPMLVLSEASLQDLSARVGQALPVERFRPNLLLDGVAPYAEDAADALGIGAARIQLTKPCTRCVITTIDQQRGERTGDEPLRTLKGYRFDKALRGVIFGRNAYAVAGVGEELRVGMPVETYTAAHD
ncbi:MAG: MOSC N-terminal beta barrel domain-containing protein [Steroidobacteraceae bacterium]